MRKMKRLLVAVLTATMVFGLCGAVTKGSSVHAEESVEQPASEKLEVTGKEVEPVENVPAEEVGEQENLTEITEVPLVNAQTSQGDGGAVPIYLTGISATIPEPVEVPLTFSVEVEARAAEEVNVSQVCLTYKNTTTGSYKAFNQELDNVWVLGETSSKQIVEVVLNKYTSAGEYELSNIEFVQPDRGYFFQYTRIDGTDNFMVSGDDEGTYEQYKYNNSADFLIGKNEDADTSAPEVHAISVLTTPIRTGGEVEISVDYAEEGAGIKYVSVNFETADDRFEWFGGTHLNEGMYTGNGTLTLKSNNARVMGDKYSLTSVRIEDYAGNQTHYFVDSNGTDLVTTDLQGNEVGRIPVVSYTVSEEMRAEWLEAIGIRLQDGVDKEQISAGDSLNIIVTLKNNAEKAYALTGGSLGAQWRSSKDTKYAYKSGFEDVIIEPGASAEITLPFDIGKFAEKDVYQWVGISYRVGEYYISYNRYDETVQGAVYRNNELVSGIPTFPYEGEMDLTVAKADTPDTEAPYIKSIRIGTQDIKTPGDVKIEVEVDDGYAKTNRITMEFADTENSKNRIDIWGASDSGIGGNMYYSEVKRCYVIEGTLEDEIVKGKYQLVNAYIDDKGNQNRTYDNIQDGKLTDFTDGAQIDSVMLEVVESERKDRDFEPPILKKIEVVNKEVTIPGEIEYRINAEDETGIANIRFQYKRGDDTYLNFYPDSITKDGNNYICKIKLGKYVWGDICELSSVFLEDGSAGNNGAYYTRRGNELYSGQNGIAVAYEGEADISLKRSQEDATLIFSMDQEINSKLQALPDGTMATITGIYPAGMTGALSKETMQIIKDKKLKVRLIMPSGKDQIVFDGAELTDEMVREFYLVFGEKSKLVNGIDFGNARDDDGYAFYLEGENNKIPLTIRVAVDEEFYQNYKDNNIRFSKDIYGMIRYQVQNENLKMSSEDGEYYVDVPIEAGEELDYRYYCISTDTTEFYDYIISTEAWIPTVSNEVVVGNEFTYNMRISNNNEEVLENILVYPEMLNREDGTEIALTGAYRFSNANSEGKARASVGNDKIIITDEGDAIITELAKGEFVELLLTVQIPETLETERVTLNTYAAIAKSETELEAFGSTNVSLTLRQPKTIIAGDINQDGVVDGSDLMYMLQVVSERIDKKELSAEQMQAGDVAGADGDITADDLMKMLQFVSERITSLD